MDKSIFADKNIMPANDELKKALTETFHLWTSVINYVHQKVENTQDEWNYPGEKYGWSFRVKDKKRAIIYLLPREGFFKVAFVFGQKATDLIMQSQVAGSIKIELANARAYAEGRGIRIDVKNEDILEDIRELIDIKLSK